ncbi:hypothetical protein RYX36_015892, partial [Vicia faba]
MAWCEVKKCAIKVDPMSIIDYGCDFLEDCVFIQPGGPCFTLDSTFSHASAMMNMFYAKN